MRRGRIVGHSEVGRAEANWLGKRTG